jgi:hypothetical protein
MIGAAGGKSGLFRRGDLKMHGFQLETSTTLSTGRAPPRTRISRTG